MSRLRGLGGVLLATTLLAGGCSGDPGPGAERQSPTTPARSAPSRAVPSPTSSEPPSPTPERACYRLGFEELPEPTSSADPVDCSDRHNAQTIHVGEFDTVVDGHAVSIDSEHARRQLMRECPRQLARFLGGTAEERRLSRFEVVWFSPTLPEADSGAEWFRCDVVALAGNERLFRLEPPPRLRGVLDGDDALSTYGLCGTAAPGAADFSRVICGRPHAWRAISTIPLAGGRDYPGQAEVRRAGDEACRDQARNLAEDPLRFRYGWEWPTSAQWDAGQHYGYCWIPD